MSPGHVTLNSEGNMFVTPEISEVQFYVTLGVS